MRNRGVQTSVREWHVAKWPALAWLETGIKLTALAFGVIALVDAIVAGDFGLPGGLRSAQLIVMALLSLGLVAAVFDRLSEREVVAMVFVVINNLGHWGIVLALMAGQMSSARLVAFSGLMLAGDLVKLVFLKVHDFRVREYPKSMLYGLTAFYVVGYGLVLTLELLR
jgi:hypothetical protein